MASAMSPWDDMTNTARGLLVGGIVVILAATIGAYFWLTREEYQVLFADMEARDASNVVSELEKLKIDYKLGKQGSQILVPASSVHDVRLKLMGSGVPLSGGVGFEIFDNTDFGMTEFAQRINYQRALEGELTRTIMSLEEVKYARVHLVMPEKGLFQQDDNPPSASVILFLKQEFLAADRRPSNAQVFGIQRLVSSAVPSLKPTHVMVTDQEGVTLSQAVTEQKSMAVVSGRLQQKQAVETYLATKVSDVLAGAFGPEKAVVSVDVDLDFNEVRRTFEKVVTPAKNEPGVTKRRETRLGNGSDTNSKSGNVTTEVEYRLGKTVEQVVEAPGRILRLNVGIVVPANTPSERREEIGKLVEVAVGFDAQRGDAIAVYTMDQAVNRLTTDLGSTPDLFVPPSVVPHETIDVRTDAVEVSTEEHRAIQWARQNVELAGAVVLFVTIFVLLLLVLAVRKKSSTAEQVTVMSLQEREEALAKIVQWLDKDGAAKNIEAL